MNALQAFPHQLEAVQKLVRTTGSNIFDDMGTGKTVTAILLDAERRKAVDWAQKRTLVVTLNGPTVDSWRRHFEAWAPDLKVVTLHPKKREMSWSTFQASKADVFIMHWDAVRLMPELQAVTWLNIIADEAHRLMHRNTVTTKSLKKIKSGYKAALTGTPSSGRPDLLWSVLNWLYPKQWRSYHKFFDHFVSWHYSNEEVNEEGEVEQNMFKPAYKVVDGPNNEQEFQQLIEPYTVRRLLRDVRPDMPPRMPPQTFYVELTPTQRRIYNEMEKSMLAWVADQPHTDDRIEPIMAEIVVAKMMRLEQFASANAYVDEEGNVQLTEPSSKLDFVMDLIKENPDAALVIFSNFKKLIRLLNARLDHAGIPYSTITGDVAALDRDAEVRRFQSGGTKVFTGTTQAGGTGIDLYASNRLVHLDRNWSAIVNQQAEGRIDRIGQTQPIQIIDVLATDTANARKLGDTQLRWSWVKQMLGDK